MAKTSSKSFRPSQTISIFLVAWFILNLCQGYFTELFNDEALYWAFSERLDFGYFDHPPMTAWLIALTSWIPGELGVRIPFIFMGIGMIYLLWYLIQPKDDVLFVALIAGLAMFHAGGFFAAPDVPLVFFLTFFLVLYQKYFYKDSWVLAVGMGLLLALMAWSKYHAILFALALALSNIELFKRKSFYLMAIVALIFILPHFYWQYINEWVTFDFHFHHRRGMKPWHFGLVGEFIGGQLLIFGPLLALLLFPSVVRFQQRDHYDCVMKYLFMVVMIFFFINAFRGRVEANWTAMVMPAVIYLGYFYIQDRPKWRKLALIFSGIGLFLLLFVRLIIAFEVLPPEIHPRNETHGFEEWSEKIGAFAQDRPVVFINNYRKPAKYAFYHGGQTYDWNMAKYSGNQYDLWYEDELALQGKEVVVVSNEVYSSDSLQFDHGIQSERVIVIPDFASYNYIDIKAEIHEEALAGSLLPEVTLTITNPTDERVVFRPDVRLQAMYFQYEVEKARNILYEGLPFSVLEPGASKTVDVSLVLPQEKGEYVMKFALFINDLAGLNSRAYFLDLK